MKNKNGKTNYVLPSILVVLVIGLLGIGYMSMSQTQIGGGDLDIDVNPETGADLPGEGCNVNPTITTSGSNSLEPGTAVTLTDVFRINGAYSTSSTGIRKGDKVVILSSNTTSYIAAIQPEIDVLCGANPVAIKLTAVATSPTVVIKNDAGLAQLTDDAAGGTTDESAFAAGGSKNFQIDITGVDKQTTGARVVVFEFSSDANISSMTLTDANTGLAMNKLTSVPAGLTVSGTNNYRVAFDMPAIEGAVKKSYNLNVQAATGNIPVGAFYSTFYIAQAFVDADGTFKVGVVNSQAATKYFGTYDYDFLVA